MHINFIFCYIITKQDPDSQNIKTKAVGVWEVNIMMLNGYVVSADLFADTVVFRQSL